MIKEPKIIFHHVPKCGGTAIVTGLVMTYYPFRFLRYGRKGFPGVLNARAATVAAEMHDLSHYAFRRKLLVYFADQGLSPLISGHYPYNHKFYAQHPGEWNPVTILRDPLERWYSEYFWNRFKDHEYRKTDVSAEEYLDSDDGKIDARSFVNFFSKCDNITAVPSAQDVQDTLDTLGSMSVVGILEHMDKFKADMKARFGRKPIFFKRNKSPANAEQKIRPDENSDFHKKLLQRLEADIEIYQKTKERLGL